VFEKAVIKINISKLEGDVISFSVTKNRLLVYSKRQVCLYNIKRQHIADEMIEEKHVDMATRTIHCEFIKSVKFETEQIIKLEVARFAAGESCYVITTDHKIATYSYKDLDIIQVLEDKHSTPNYRVIRADISPCGRIFVASMKDEMVIRDTKSWREVFVFGGEARVLAMSTDILIFEGKDYNNDVRLGIINFTHNRECARV